MIVQSKLTEARALLSTLYLFFILNIVFRDIHQFLSPGYMDWVIAGEMFGMEITDGLMLFGAFAVEPFIAMVLLARILPRKAVRIINPLVALWTGLLIFSTPPIDPDDIFFLVICAVTLLAIIYVGHRHFAPEREV